jgi:DNA-binding transcriptional regulator LsrR (DeoR family)
VDTPTNPNDLPRPGREAAVAPELYAPAYVRTARSGIVSGSRTRRSHPEAAARADVALVGIGSVDDGRTMVRSGCLLEEIARLRDQGPYDPSATRDAGGRLIASPHSDRLIGSPSTTCAGETVAVVGEAEKPLPGVLRALSMPVVDEGAHAVSITHPATGDDPDREPVRGMRR